MTLIIIIFFRFIKRNILRLLKCICVLTFIFACIRLIIRINYTGHKTCSEIQPVEMILPEKDNRVERFPEIEQTPDQNSKFILLVTSKVPRKYPFTLFPNGNSIFVNNECEFTNCFITNNRRQYVHEYHYDLVAFNAADMENIVVPRRRTTKQKYAFFSFESPHNYPVCKDKYDDFFNLTFTYKLDSDYRWWFFDIYNKSEIKIGPAVDMKWQNFSPLDDDTKDKIDNKTKMVAWFASNCDTLSAREEFVRELNGELHKKYGVSVDTYGACGKYLCPRKYSKICNKKIEDDYYFYLAFENSFAEDYVTEKILTAIDNYAIPIVYGNANYSRFLPPNSYLSVLELGIQELARIMHKLVTHPELLYEYLRFHNHISYQRMSSRTQICSLCSLLNNKTEMNKIRTYPKFRNWWNNPDWEYRCPGRSHLL